MNYVISSKVTRGDGYGRQIGFPTINLETKATKLPAEGIYAGEVSLDGKKYQAGIVVNPKNKIEAHLIGFDGDAYGKEVVLEIGKFLRKFKKFKTEIDLIKQIKNDLDLVIRI